MLSYMREDNGNDTTSANEDEQPQKVQTSGRPKGTEREYLLPSNNSRSVKRSTIVLLVLFVAGLLLLLFMVKRINPATVQAAMSEDAMQIEQAVANLTGIKAEMNGRLAGAVQKIASLSEIDQVGVSELKKNPFRHGFGIQNGEGLLTGKLNKSKGSLAKASVGNADTLHLWSIISSGDKRSCMINDEILYQGDTIIGLRVESIGKDFVELAGSRGRIVLRISQ